MKRKIVALVLVISISITLLVMATFFAQIGGNSDSTIRVACVGDSITLGTGYTVDLWHRLGSNYIVGNFGVDGATVYLSIGSAYMKQTACQVAQRFEPNIVVIMLGTNDANPDLNESNAVFVSDYATLVNAFQGIASKPKVWIVIPPPIFNNTVQLSGEYLTEKVIPNIEQVANQTHVPTINANTPLGNETKYFIDGVHPNAFGAWALATTVYYAIR